MKKFVIQAITLLAVIFGALAIYTGKLPNNLRLGPPPQTQTSEVVIGGVKIKVDLATSPEKRRQGLGGREFLASDSGMLFIFEKPDRHAFWMKGLNFPLDFMWIRNRVIVDIIKEAKPPTESQKDEDLPIYLPQIPVDMVLEVTGGFVDSHNIKIGDNIEIVK